MARLQSYRITSIQVGAGHPDLSVKIKSTAIASETVPMNCEGTDSLRIYIMALLLLPASIEAQTRQAAAPAPALAAPTTSSPVTPDEISPSDRARPLAGSKRDNVILSKNEAYNLGRVAEGRVGVRLGNDVSYRITGN